MTNPPKHLADKSVLKLEVIKVIAHRRGAECAEVFIKKSSLCGLCASAAKHIKRIEFLNLVTFNFSAHAFKYY